MTRGTSVYFADEVIPMLPPALSNGACSLTAGEDKAALSAYLTLSPDGALVSCRVERTVIRSRVRGVYSEINELLASGDNAELIDKYRAVLPSLRRMHELYLLLSARSERRGAMTLDRPEPEIVLDETGFPIEIRRRERGDAERMIEQFMLLANEGVATLMHDRNIPCVYRIHENPPPDKLTAFLQYAQLLGLEVSSVDVGHPSPRELTALLVAAREKGISEAISYPMLRAMSKASYSEAPKGHFGLGLSLYCHFTSPIRRLSDLATHRILKAVYLDGENPQRYAGYAKRAAAAATEAELRALDAERKIEAMYKALYLSRHIGEVFSGRITSVAGFGFFVELENACEGLVPLGSLPGYFLFDERSSALVAGELAYAPGMTVSVRVEDVDPMRGQVTFALEG
jgi:ribonuclease R